MREHAVTIPLETCETSSAASLLHGGDATRDKRREQRAANTPRVLAAASCALAGALALARARSGSSVRSDARLGLANGVDLLTGGGAFPRATKLLPRDAEASAWDDSRANFALYHADGDADLSRGEYYDFDPWPTSELADAVLTLKVKEPATYDAFEGVHEDHDRLIADRIDARKHVGPALSAVMAWTKAKRDGESALIVATPEGYINSHSGPPTEFDSFVLSFLLRGPKNWDVLFLDRGERGVSEENLKRPEALFTNKAWEHPYVLYNNTASVVGMRLETHFYMVSKSFLDGVAANMKANKLVNVDDWMNYHCSHGLMNCYSYNSERWYDGLNDAHKAKAVEPVNRAPLVDKTVVVESEEKSEKSESETEPSDATKTTSIESAETSVQMDPLDAQVRALQMKQGAVGLGDSRHPVNVAAETRAFLGDAEVSKFF